MPITPGRPHSPTTHPRTRPEGMEYATKMRSTSDWFRHDGKNVASPPPGPSRMGDHRGEEVAAKSKGDPAQWFKHNASNPPEDRPPTRCPTEESQKYHNKIYGKEEAWYKHDDNRDYFSPHAANRLPPFGTSLEIKDKRTKADTMNWYRHEHGMGDNYETPPARHRTPTRHAEDNERKLQGRPGTPEWFSHDHKDENGSAEYQNGRARVATADAEEYLERNRHGSATDWYQHTATPDPNGCPSPRRMASKEGEDNAKKLGTVSENWFSHDANKSYVLPRPSSKANCTLAHDMIEKSRGNQMRQTLNQQGMRPSASAEPRIKPEAQEIAQKNIQGLMDKYLKQSEDYSSPRPAPRVKPEAQATAEKNKGVMNDCMGGYPDQPVKKEGPRVKPEAQMIANRNKGTANQVIRGDVPGSARGASRAIKPEAQENARRNEGTLKHVMDNYGQLEISGRPVQRLNTTVAKEIAARNKGTLEMKW